tara:strand:- start:2 stop:550 length:549 start_codon:yes stop_codon:yes gene_type:complete
MVEIIDNFLDDSDFLPLQELMEGVEFPWYFTKYSTLESELKKDIHDYQLIHIFYMLNDTGCLVANSDNCYFLNPILKKLNCLHLIRCKANLRTIDKGEQKNHPHYYHTDIHYPHWQIPTVTAIFYVNTNNGYTILEDKKQKVKCVANRLLKFDSTMKHAAVGSTDSKRRIVINFNYIEKKND